MPTEEKDPLFPDEETSAAEKQADKSPDVTVEEISSAPETEPIKVGFDITVQEISVHPREHRPLHPNTVKFMVKYPKDYPADKKHMPEGPVLVSKEAAEHFTKLGIGAVAKKK